MNYPETLHLEISSLNLPKLSTGNVTVITPPAGISLGIENETSKSAGNFALLGKDSTLEKVTEPGINYSCNIGGDKLAF